MSTDEMVRVESERDDELVHHESDNSHLCSTAVVELGELLVFIECVPSESMYSL